MVKTPISTTDPALQVRVELALTRWSDKQPGRASNRLVVLATQAGEITLRGTVHSQAFADQASRIAGEIPGVKTVFNQIATTRQTWPTARHHHS